jgi:hypothetical protein
MATISNTPRPGYVWDVTDNVWYPIGVGGHSHSEIAKTIVDVKGDLIVGTAADTVDRLAVGNNGETLVADSVASTGLRYSATPSASNPVINGAMQVWQRGTTSADSAGSPYTADRWQMFRSGVAGATTTRQVTGDTTNLPSVQYCARVQRNSGNTAVNGIFFAQTVESLNSIPFAGKTVTVSFYARAGANYSSASSVLSSVFVSGTGTDQNVASGLTGQATVVSANNTLTTTWQRFSITGTIAATATQIALYYTYTPVGTAGANDYFEVTGVQIDIGSVALPFRTYAATIQGELAACQRYYQRNYPAYAYAAYAIGGTTSATVANALVFLPVPLRVNATSIEYSNLLINDTTNNAAITSLTIQNTGYQVIQISATASGGGLTSFRPYSITNNSGTTGYLGFSAEL